MKRKLGIFETAQTISGEYFPFNAVGILRSINSPKPEFVQRSLLILQDRHPLLKMRITKEKAHYFFVSEGTPEIRLDILRREDDDHWKSVCEEELNHTFDIEKGPLIRCRYLYSDMQPAEAEIIITCHHSIIDAKSVVRIFHELLSLCHTIQKDGLPRNYPPLSLLLPEESYFPAAFRGLSGKSRILRFMLGQIGDEIKYRRLTRSKRKPPIHARARCCILTAKLSPEHTDKLIRQSRRKRVSLNSCLSAAMLLSVTKYLYENQNLPMRHFTFADLRPYLKPPVSEYNLGSYHSMMRLTIPVNKDQNFWDLAQQVNQQVYSASKKGHKFIQPLLSAKMMRMFIRFQKMRMGTTALSYPGVTKIEPVYGETQVKVIHGFVSNFPIGPEYSATARIFNHQLYLDSLYLDSDLDQAKAQMIANEILSILRAG
jgi:NRPS condensation-like uncharacterized protein